MATATATIDDEDVDVAGTRSLAAVPFPFVLQVFCFEAGKGGMSAEQCVCGNRREKEQSGREVRSLLFSLFVFLAPSAFSRNGKF